MAKKYLCKLCGQVVEPLEDGSCPVCGASEDMLEPVEEEEQH